MKKQRFNLGKGVKRTPLTVSSLPSSAGNQTIHKLLTRTKIHPNYLLILNCTFVDNFTTWICGCATIDNGACNHSHTPSHNTTSRKNTACRRKPTKTGNVLCKALLVVISFSREKPLQGAASVEHHERERLHGFRCLAVKPLREQSWANGVKNTSWTHWLCCGAQWARSNMQTETIDHGPLP